MQLFVILAVIGGFMAVIGAIVISRTNRIREKATPEDDPGILAMPYDAQGALACYCDVAQRLDECMTFYEDMGSATLTGEYTLGGTGSVLFRYYKDVGILDWVIEKWGIRLPQADAVGREGWYLTGYLKNEDLVYESHGVTGYPEWIGLDSRVSDYLDYEQIKRTWIDGIERIIRTHWKNARIKNTMAEITDDHRCFRFLVTIETYPIKTYTK